MQEDEGQNQYFMDIYFEEIKRHLPFIAMWTNICNTSVSGTSVPLRNSQAEIYFHIKKSDREANNIPTVQYIEKNNCFRLSIQRQNIDTLCKSAFHQNQKGFSKGSLLNLKMFYAKHYDSAGRGEYENDPIMLEANNSEEKDKGVELEEEMWTPKAAHTNPRKRKSYLKKLERPLQFCSSAKASRTKEVDNNIKRHRIKNKSNVNGLDAEHEISFNDEKEDDI